MRRTRRSLFVLFAASALILLACALFVFRTRERPSGHLRLQVVDAYSLLPLSGACILLPESGLSGYTGSDGMLDLANIPVRTDSARDTALARGFGEVTLLCYHARYRPYALFFARVNPNAVRTLTLYLFPLEDDASPTTVVEAPPEAWVRELVKLYAP